MGQGEQKQEAEGVAEWLEGGLEGSERPTAWMDEPLPEGEGGDGPAQGGEGEGATPPIGGPVLGSSTGVIMAIGAGLAVAEVIIRGLRRDEILEVIVASQSALLTTFLLLALALAWEDFWAWFGVSRPEGEERLAYLSPKGKGLAVLGEALLVGILSCCAHIGIYLDKAGSRWVDAIPEASAQGGVYLLVYIVGYLTLHSMVSSNLKVLADKNTPERPVDFASASTFFGGLLIGTLYYFIEAPGGRVTDEHIFYSLASGLGAFIALRVSLGLLRLFLVVLRALILVVALPALAFLAALVANPHCLEPIEDGGPEELGYCVLYSTVDGDLDLPGRSTWWESWARSEPLVPEAGLHFATWSGEGASDLLPLSSTSPTPDLNACMGELYENPVKQVEAFAMRRFDLDHDLAHDVAFRTLFQVCTHHTANPVKALPSYYVAAAKYEMKRESDRLKGRVQPLPLSVSGQSCLRPSPFGPTQELMEVLNQGLASMPAEQRTVINRFLWGDKMKEISADLNIPLQLVKSRKQQATKTLRLHLDKFICQL